MSILWNEWRMSRGVADTWRMAAELAEACPARLIVALHGDLGTGKTCFVQGLARALGITRPVASPTFTLIQEYPGARPLYHMDLYRIERAVEAEGLALDEYFERAGVCAIEWAEHAPELIPADAVHVRLRMGARPTTREIRMERPGLSGG